jgi:hypothetical protein
VIIGMLAHLSNHSTKSYLFFSHGSIKLCLHYIQLSLLSIQSSLG